MTFNDKTTDQLVGEVLGALTITLLVAWLVSLSCSWLFPMLVLPYWKWLVITLTIQFLFKK